MSSNRRVSVPAIGLRRSPRRRTKTPSLNELSKKYKISPRGKRRLEFQHEKHQEPLKGCTFYLDLENYRKAGSLKARIKELGGAVEEFLSKDISCVVTNKKDADSHCSPRSNSTPSPILSIPSPFPGNTKSSSAKGSAIPSPLSADSCGTEQNGPTSTKHNMRGKALAAHAAITYKCGTSNVTANARNWGLQIVSLEKMLEKLEQYGSILKKPTSKALVTGRVAKQGVKPKVRKLHSPFIKVEDHSRAYKPLVHELKDWPKIYFDGSSGSGPFDPPKRDVEHKHDCREPARAKRKSVHEDKNKKKGFCECCCLHYKDLDMHLHSDRHQAFARDSSNYKSLDELIKRGPSLQEFLEKVLLKHQQKKKEMKEENRTEIPGSQKSVADRAEEKTPSKQNNQEVIPVYQTPPDQGLMENEGYQTPTNPFPERPACCTPTTTSSPGRKYTDYDTPRRTSRQRTGKGSLKFKEAEVRELRSSPGHSGSKTSSLKAGAAALTAEYVRVKRINSEKTSLKAATERVPNTRLRSSSFRSTATCSKRDKCASSPSPREDLVRDDSTRRQRISPVQNVENNDADEETRNCEQGSSGENSCKENQQPKSSVFHSNMASYDKDSVVQTKLRPRRLQSDGNEVDEVKCKAGSLSESGLELQNKSPERTHLRQDREENFCETFILKKDSFKSTEQTVDEQPRNNIVVESLENKHRVQRLVTHASNLQQDSPPNTSGESLKPKNTRSARKGKLSDCCDENGLIVESHEELTQDKEPAVEIESPRNTQDTIFVEQNHSELHHVNKDSAIIRETSMQNIQMTSLETKVLQESEQDIEIERIKRSYLGSATMENHQKSCHNEKDHTSAHEEMPTKHFYERDNVVKSCEASVLKKSGQNIEMESAKRPCLRSATRGNHGDEKPDVEHLPETIQNNTQMESPKMSCLRSPSKGDNMQPKSTGSSQTREDKKEGKTEKGKRSSDKTLTKKPKKNGKMLTDQQENTEIAKANTDSDVTCTRSRVKSAPAATTHSSPSSDSLRPAADVKLVRNSYVDSEPQRKLLISKNEVREITEEIEVNQSSKRSFRDLKDPSNVVVKLSDCKKSCVDRKRPLLDVDSSYSDTESIQMSNGQTSSKETPAEDVFSDNDENDLSSTPTLDHCSSPASSDKSGFSDESSARSRGFIFRRHAEQDECDSKLCYRTRSKYKIPDNPMSYRHRKRRTVSTDYTSVKSKSRSFKQRSHSVQSHQTRTPKKKVKKEEKEQMKNPETRPCRGEAFQMKDLSFEADLSATSSGPRRGSTHACGVLTAVRNLQKLAVDSVDEIIDPFLSSDTIVSLEDVSVTAVRGSPACMESAKNCVTGKYSGIQLFEGSPRIKKDFHSAAFAVKHSEKRSSVTLLFESDDEDEEFNGFDVPQFFGSFSSEGECEGLSYRINSIVESINYGTDEATVTDSQKNVTVEEVKTSDEDAEVEEYIGREEEPSIKKIGARKGAFDGDVEIKQNEAARVLEERRSTTPVDILGSNVLDPRPSAVKTSVVDIISKEGTDDFDENDDVFNAVAGSTDGEDDDDDAAVSSPFNISSWTRKLNFENFRAEVSEQVEDYVSSSTYSNWRRKRKYEDPQPELGRPTKRRKSDEGAEVDCSSECSKAVTPVKTGALYTLYETIEERVKLRRIMELSLKEYENSQTVREQNDHNVQSSAKEMDGQKFPPLKPLKGNSTIRTSPSVRPINTSSSSFPSPLAGPSRKSRRATWTSDVNAFASPPSATSGFKGRQVRCSTPMSASTPSQRTLKEKSGEKFPPLKPLKGVYRIGTSPRASPINSSQSSNPSLLPVPSRKSRRATWIYDANAFASPSPVSAITPSRRTLRSRRHQKGTEDSIPQISRQGRDVFAFDE
ncbi:uncharacterized protein LOC111336681 [Stylophora pistillata]|uniref:Protein DBF4-like A n=1 Tax=Stylophora pistillata TaxID=50429 RepID=A0A2B4RQ92_STYPI|nr:uncharacterized protein LOC111336681 [Stylophora pistillata]PFX20604.1 Protein DBF4-like A [Stylophora pistillata]